MKPEAANGWEMIYRKVATHRSPKIEAFPALSFLLTAFVLCILQLETKIISKLLKQQNQLSQDKVFIQTQMQH